MAASGNLIRVNAMLDPEEVKAIDTRAGQLGVSRSALLRDAIQAYLSSNQPPFAPRPREEALALLEKARQVGARIGSDWDPVIELRRWRERH